MAGHCAAAIDRETSLRGDLMRAAPAQPIARQLEKFDFGARP